MLASPRVAVLVMLTLATALLPQAAAGPSDCIELVSASYGHGLAALILGIQNGIAVGLASSEPGGGVYLLAMIDPVACTGVGLGAGSNSASDPTGAIDPYTTWLPLP